MIIAMDIYKSNIHTRLVNGVLMALPVKILNSSVFYLFGTGWNEDELVFGGCLLMLMVCLGSRMPRFAILKGKPVFLHLVSALMILTARWIVLRFIIFPIYCWTVIWIFDGVLPSLKSTPSDWNNWIPLMAMLPAVISSFAYSSRTYYDRSKYEQNIHEYNNDSNVANSCRYPIEKRIMKPKSIENLTTKLTENFSGSAPNEPSTCNHEDTTTNHLSRDDLGVGQMSRDGKLTISPTRDVICIDATPSKSMIHSPEVVRTAKSIHASDMTYSAENSCFANTDITPAIAARIGEKLDQRSTMRHPRHLAMCQLESFSRFTGIGRRDSESSSHDDLARQTANDARRFQWRNRRFDQNSQNVFSRGVEFPGSPRYAGHMPTLDIHTSYPTSGHYDRGFESEGVFAHNNDYVTSRVQPSVTLQCIEHSPRIESVDYVLDDLSHLNPRPPPSPTWSSCSSTRSSLSATTVVSEHTPPPPPPFDTNLSQEEPDHEQPYCLPSTSNMANVVYNIDLSQFNQVSRDNLARSQSDLPDCLYQVKTCIDSI